MDIRIEACLLDIQQSIEEIFIFPGDRSELNEVAFPNYRAIQH